MSIKRTLQVTYLDYLNNYPTMAKFAQDNGLTLAQATALIDLGRSVHESIVVLHDAVVGVPFIERKL